ncbi:integrase, catalytic region, zinc finger, CCHC-type containing protein, partial [Tanacetum coccineum]
KVAQKTTPRMNNPEMLKDVTNISSISRSKGVESNVVQIVLWYLDFECSKHMTGNRSQLINFIHKFVGTVIFGNDQIAKIMGYDDYQMSNVTISRVYYVEGFGHNLFSVRQFCDSNLEVALRKHTFYILDLEGVDLLKGSRGSNLYTLSLEDMMLSSPICLLSKASKTNLGYGFEAKSKKHTHKPKAEGYIQEKLYLLHMDICRPMRIQSINGKKYTLNGLIERRNRTLVETARTMLIFSKAPLFLQAEAVAIACYTQNRSLVCKRNNKTPYELLHNRKLDLSYLYVFGALCYPTNDSEDLSKLKPKADIEIFVGYALAKKAYRIYNKRTRYVDCDEIQAMASE